jgi:putative endonuclease
MCHKLSRINITEKTSDLLSKRAKGDMGEDIACRFLRSKGFIITDRNYQKKWGEIDIIARKGKSIHFFEVKSVMKYPVMNTKSFDFYRPEDNVHSFKVRHLRKMIETYLAEKRMKPDAEFYFHILCVFMNIRTHRAKVQWIENVIL